MKRVLIRQLDLSEADVRDVFVATTQKLVAGEGFLLELNYKHWPNNLIVTATANSVQPALPRRRQRAGVWVRMDGETQQKILRFDQAVSQGGPIIKRRHERIPLVLKVRAHVDGQVYAVSTQDIGLGGAALRGTLPPNTRAFMLELPAPGDGKPVAVAARLVHRRDAKDGSAIFGAQFIIKTADGALRISEVLRRLVAAL